MTRILQRLAAVLLAYPSRIVALAGVVTSVTVGLYLSHFETASVGGSLGMFECLIAITGAYIGWALDRQLRAHVSSVVPGYKWTHLATAFGLDLLVVTACVGGASFIGKGENWASVSYLGMFALLWGWSLVWISAGHLFGKVAFSIVAMIHFPVLPSLPDVVEPFLWRLLHRLDSPDSVFLLAADGAATFFLALYLVRRTERASLKQGFRKILVGESAPRSLDHIRHTMGEGLTSRIRHFELTLKRDYWLVTLTVFAGALLSERYRRGAGSTFGSAFQSIYEWCFISCYFMLGQDVFTQKRLRSLLQLPFKRQTLVREYGLTLFLSCVRRWCAYVLVAWVAFRVPLPGAEPLSAPVEVWAYCLGILLIVFGLRALVAPEINRLQHQLLVVMPICLYASFSELLPMSPTLAIFLGLGLIVGSYYRWSTVEIG